MKKIKIEFEDYTALYEFTKKAERFNISYHYESNNPNDKGLVITMRPNDYIIISDAIIIELI